MEIEESPHLPEIRIGKWVSDYVYYSHPTKEADPCLKNEILEANGIKSVLAIAGKAPEESRRYHNEMAEHLGPKFYARLRAASFNLWIAPIKNKLDSYCFYSTGFQHYYQQDQLRRLWNNLKLVSTLESDGLFNIIPLAIYFCATPQTLKKELGKGLWRKIAGNSMGRNKQLVLMMIADLDLKRKRYKSKPKCFKSYKEYLLDLSEVKSTLLRLYLSRKLEFIHTNTLQEKSQTLIWLSKHSKVTVLDDVRRLSHLYNDTERMGKKLGLKIKRLPPKKITALTYTDVALKHLQQHKKTIIYNEVTITLLYSPFLMAREGMEMKHCIASYVYAAKDGYYVAYAMDNNDARSTLGIKIENGSKHTIHQHYGACNSKVIDEQLIEASNYVIATLNHQIVEPINNVWLPL